MIREVKKMLVLARNYLIFKWYDLLAKIIKKIRTSDS